MGDVMHARDADERGEGICRTCCEPIWNEGGTVGHRKFTEGWSDRIERRGDSLVCFKAVEYRHVPLTGREAAIYDRAFTRGAQSTAPSDSTEEAASPARDEPSAPRVPGHWLAETSESFLSDDVEWRCGCGASGHARGRAGAQGDFGRHVTRTLTTEEG